MTSTPHVSVRGGGVEWKCRTAKMRVDYAMGQMVGNEDMVETGWHGRLTLWVWRHVQVVLCMGS